MRGVPNPEERTEKILKDLGISHVADTVIGGPNQYQNQIYFKVFQPQKCFLSIRNCFFFIDL